MGDGRVAEALVSHMDKGMDAFLGWERTFGDARDWLPNNVIQVPVSLFNKDTRNENNPEAKSKVFSDLPDDEQIQRLNRELFGEHKLTVCAESFKQGKLH